MFEVCLRPEKGAHAQTAIAMLLATSMSALVVSAYLCLRSGMGPFGFVVGLVPLASLLAIVVVPFVLIAGVPMLYWLRHKGLLVSPYAFFAWGAAIAAISFFVLRGFGVLDPSDVPVESLTLAARLGRTSFELVTITVLSGGIGGIALWMLEGRWTGTMLSQRSPE